MHFSDQLMDHKTSPFAVETIAHKHRLTAVRQKRTRSFKEFALFLPTQRPTGLVNPPRNRDRPFAHAQGDHNQFVSVMLADRALINDQNRLLTIRTRKGQGLPRKRPHDSVNIDQFIAQEALNPLEPR